MSVIAISFLLFLSSFLCIGLWSTRHKDKTNTDYFLAGRNQPAWLISLSAVATNNSGYMFIGLIGLTYTVGLSSMWVMIGWIGGDILASVLIHRRLRVRSQRNDLLTFGGVLGNWHKQEYKKVRFLSGLITVVFLGVYAAAQLSAGGKALHVLFGWNHAVGILIGTIIVVVYCFAGGIRASIWTDAAQSFVMIVSMFLLLVISVMKFGSVSALLVALHNVSDTYMNFWPVGKGGIGGNILFIVSWFCTGYGVVGQPHIMVRFMAMDKPSDITRVRAYYYTWYISFTVMTIAVALVSRVLLPTIKGFDAELALPHLALLLLPPVLIGFVLAGLFAATMSTADSQILSCSAALTRDLTNGMKIRYHWSKAATLLTSALILVIALFGDKSVFSLVVLAWGVLASSFAPLLTVYTFSGQPSERTALSMMLVGAGIAIILQYTVIAQYSVTFGLAAGFLVFFLSLLKSSPRNKEN